MVQPFFAFYLTGERGLSASEAGWVVSAFGVGAVLSPLPAGWLADRIGRRATLASGTLCTALAMLALGYSSGIRQLLVSMVALGLSMDAYRPASQAMVADLVSEALRPRAYGLLFWAVNLGYVGGVLVGGSLAHSHFLAAVWIDSATCLVFGLLVWWGVPGSVLGATAPRAAQKARGTGFGDVLRDPVIVLYVVVTFGYCLVYLQSVFTLPLALKEAGFPPSAFAGVMVVNAGLIVVLQPWAAVRLEKRDQCATAVVGILLTAAGFAAMAFATSTVEFALCVAVWTLGEIAMSSVGAAIVSSLSPPHLRGRSNGLYGFAWSSATLLAPLLGSKALTFGQDVLWTACALVALAATIGQLLLTPAIRARRG